jgi:hypothetical protein
MACSAAPAAAAVFSYSFDVNDSTFSGTDGFSSGYCDDLWTTAMNGGVTPKTDDACDGLDGCTADNNCGDEFGIWNNCSGSDPLDNHLTVGNAAWADYQFTARFRNMDDDTVGFVFRYQDSRNFYLFFLSQDVAPSLEHGCATVTKGSRLWRVSDGKPTQLVASTASYVPGWIHKVQITVVANSIKIYLDSDADDLIGPDEVLAIVNDNAGPKTGKVGFFAYDNGASGDASVNPCMQGGCFFDDLTVDIYSLGDDPCDGISWEGVCQGNSVVFCQWGQQLETKQCEGCCGWEADHGYYGCLWGQACSGCQDECSPGESGCSDQLSHHWSCGQADNDPCTERIFSFCVGTGLCDPSSGECLCDPKCGGKKCGDDGCGGVCGTCAPGSECANGTCTCIPTCNGAACGDDGCGGLCGACPFQHVCQNGACVCQPSCPGKQCGSDGCSGSCGTCGVGTECQGGVCQCVPDCTGKMCGDDGCGATCGDCLPTQSCQAGACVDQCQPSCTGAECGDDGCGGSCGTCPPDVACIDGLCEGQCHPQCDGKQCGYDGCGGVCGECLPAEECSWDGLCMPVCQPSCLGKQCGDDGCGGNCGICLAGLLCGAQGQCLCTPQCAGVQCGDDGCGGLCGTCSDAQHCTDGACVEGPCQVQCEGRECGFDGCTGTCGACPVDKTCMDGLCIDAVCVPSCVGKECGSDGCAGSCGECTEGLICSDLFTCTVPPACRQLAYKQCVGKSLFWFDAAGNQCQLDVVCPFECVDSQCAGEPPEDIVIAETEEDLSVDTAPDPGSVDTSSDLSGDEVLLPGGDTISFDASGSKSGGCAMGAGQTSASPAALLLLLLLLGRSLLSRRLEANR